MFEGQSISVDTRRSCLCLVSSVCLRLTSFLFYDPFLSLVVARISRNQNRPRRKRIHNHRAPALTVLNRRTSETMLPPDRIQQPDHQHTSTNHQINYHQLHQVNNATPLPQSHTSRSSRQIYHHATTITRR